MLPLTHLDGSDVVVTDDRGHQVPAIEVRVEPGIAVIAVDAGARDWLRDLLRRAPHETLVGAVRSVIDGHLHHCGASCACEHHALFARTQWINPPIRPTAPPWSSAWSTPPAAERGVTASRRDCRSSGSPPFSSHGVASACARVCDSRRS